MTNTLTLTLCLFLAACGGGGNECAIEANKAAGWYQKDGHWYSYVIDGCGARIESPLPPGVTPAVQN